MSLLSNLSAPAPHAMRRPNPAALDCETAAALFVLGIALVVGLMTAGDYGMTIDEFNTDDYGPRALAWYTSGFTDRAVFETPEEFLWYYGPWFQMLVAAVQALKLADPLTVRHALTFTVGLAGLAALLPAGHLSFGRWTGFVALTLCLLTGNLYGSLFFGSIDTPFLAAMCWSTLAIMAMARKTVPAWPATVGAGVATGLAIAIRTGGVIVHAYLVGAMVLCAIEAAVNGAAPVKHVLWRIALRTTVVIVLAWVIVFALWPWLQIGNPFTQLEIAHDYFQHLDTDFTFTHWGHTVSSVALPVTYIPAQWLVRLPLGFLALIAGAVLMGVVAAVHWLRLGWAELHAHGVAGLREPLLLLARSRNVLLVWVAAAAPPALLVVRHGALYDGVRHTLFVIPMLGLLGGWAAVRSWQWLGRSRMVAAALAVAYTVVLVVNLVALHPLEYIAMNAVPGGVAGAYDRFDLDYWAVAVTEATRRLERRLRSRGIVSQSLPSILLCIPWREERVGPILRGKWRIELDPDKADFVIASERSRCADGHDQLVLIDEVTRDQRAFAWTYGNRRSPLFEAAQ